MDRLSTPSPQSSSFLSYDDDIDDNDDEDSSSIMKTADGRSFMRILHAKSQVCIQQIGSDRPSIDGFLALFQKATKKSEYRSDDIPSPNALFLGWVDARSLEEGQRQIYLNVEMGKGLSSSPKMVPVPRTALTADFVLTGAPFLVGLSALRFMRLIPPRDGPQGSPGHLTLFDNKKSPFPTFYFLDGFSRSSSRSHTDAWLKSGAPSWGGEEVLTWLQMWTRVVASGEEGMYEFMCQPDAGNASASNLSAFPVSGPTSRQPSQPLNVTDQSRVDNVRAGNIPMSILQPPAVGFPTTRRELLGAFSHIPSLFRRAPQTATSVITAKMQGLGISEKGHSLLSLPEVQSLTDQYNTALLYIVSRSLDKVMAAGQSQYNIPKARDFIQVESESELGPYQLVTLDLQNLQTENFASVSIQEWNGWFDSTGCLQVDVDTVKERIFHGGLSDEVRPIALPFLLGVYDWYSNLAERTVAFEEKREEYGRLKSRWIDFLFKEPGPEESEDVKKKYANWVQQRQQIDKDVHRMDRDVELFSEGRMTYPDCESSVNNNPHLSQCRSILLAYNELNVELGYVQGMSDLLAPLYAILQDDGLSFWCFVKYMERMEPNFRVDQTGMKFQLKVLGQTLRLLDPRLYKHLEKIESTDFFFMYRMILVRFKRELGWEDVIRFWEATWTDYLTSSFHIFFALAILRQHREHILTQVHAFDEMIRFNNSLTDNLDLQVLLQGAEKIFRELEHAVRAHGYADDDSSPALGSSSAKPDGFVQLADSVGSTVSLTDADERDGPGGTILARSEVGPEGEVIRHSGPEERGGSDGGNAQLSDSRPEGARGPSGEIPIEVRLLLSRSPLLIAPVV